MADDRGYSAAKADSLRQFSKENSITLRQLLDEFTAFADDIEGSPDKPVIPPPEEYPGGRQDELGQVRYNFVIARHRRVRTQNLARLDIMAAKQQIAATSILKFCLAMTDEFRVEWLPALIRSAIRLTTTEFVSLPLSKNELLTSMSDHF